MRAESLKAKLLMHMQGRKNTSAQTGLTLLFQDVVEHEKHYTMYKPRPQPLAIFSHITFKTICPT